MSDSTPSRGLGREIWVLVAASFVIALGFGIVAPALPLFARQFGVGDTAAAAIISSFALMRLLFAPAAGAMVQRFGERPVYLVGLLIVAASTAACAVAPNYLSLLIFRSVGGIGSTMFTVSALGLLIRVSPSDMRGRVAGLYATSFLLGTIGGPLLGSATVQFGLRAPFVVYSVALVVAATVVFVALRVPVDNAAADAAAPALTLRHAWTSPSYRAAVGANFANGWAVFGVRTAIVPLLVVDALRSEPAVTGIVLAVFAVGNAAVLAASGRLSDRRGRRPFVIGGLVVCGLATAVMGISDSVAVLLVLSFVAGLGSGALSPALQASVADVVGARARGGPVLATFQMASDVGAVIGPLAAGVLVEYVSFEAAFATAGALLLIAAAGWVRAPETADLTRATPKSTRPQVERVRTRLRPVASLIARLSLAAVWLTSGVIKAADPTGTVVAVRAYRLLPEELVRGVAASLPFVEIGLGLLLLIGLGVRIVATVSAALLVTLIAVIVSVWARGMSIDCGCFGGGGAADVGAWDYIAEIARDVGFLALACWLIVFPRSPCSLGPSSRVRGVGGGDVVDGVGTGHVTVVR